MRHNVWKIFLLRLPATPRMLRWCHETQNQFSARHVLKMFARDTKDRQAPNSWTSGGHCWPQLSILKTFKYTVVFDWHCYFHELLGLVTLMFWLVYMLTFSVLGFLGWRFTFLQILWVHIFPDSKNVRLTVSIHTISGAECCFS